MEGRRISAPDLNYMKDVDDVRYATSTDEDDDDDEPRLQIDLSGAEDENTDQDGNSSVSSNTTRSNSEGGPNNPLRSLQKLVHSPFLNQQISSSGVNGSQGCDITPVVSGGSKSITISNVPTAPMSTSRSSAIANESHSSSSRMFNALPTLTPRPGAQDRRRSSTPPSSANLIRRVLTKLKHAAQDERSLRTLQRLPYEEAQSFKHFRDILQSKSMPDTLPMPVLQPSPGRANLHPALATIVDSDGMIRFSPHIDRVKPSSKLNIRTPPTLTVIPTTVDSVSVHQRKSSCNRSPPPMVPINFFRKQLTDDNVVNRLKRLGTDIEIETNPLPKLKDDYDPLIPDCVLTTPETVVTKLDDSCLPSLHFMPNDRYTNVQPCTSSSVPPPPPPSLIPITRVPKTVPRFIPILPRTQPPSQLIHEAATKAAVMPPKKKRKITYKTEFSKLAHSLVQPASIVRLNEADSEANLMLNAMRHVSIMIDDQPRLMVNEVEIIKLDDNPTEQVQTAATQTVPTALSTPGSVPSPPALIPASVENLREAEPVPQEASPPRFFVFKSEQGINSTALSNGRKLYACAICSAVYHKTYSVKKHMFRSHINPRFISAEDIVKFEVTVPPEAAAMDSVATGMYQCLTCSKTFDEPEDLKSHLLDHPPTSDDSSRRRTGEYRCNGCGLIFYRKKLHASHLLDCIALEKTMPLPSPPSSNEKILPVILEETNTEANNKKVDAPKKDELMSVCMLCLFCEVKFKDNNERQKHVLQQHHPKRKHQSCSYCKKRGFNDLRDLLRHICGAHSENYFGCADCKIRFKTKEDLVAHNMESHPNNKTSSNVAPVIEEKVKPVPVVRKNGRTFKCSKCLKVCESMTELIRHRKAEHRHSKIKSSAKSLSYDPKYRGAYSSDSDYEWDFFTKIIPNVKTNLDQFMEGKLDMRRPDSKTVTRSSLTLLAPIEKERESLLTFQDMYGAENICTQFIRNVSRLHLATQMKLLKLAHLLNEDLPGDSHHQNVRTCIVRELSLTPQRSESELQSVQPSTDIETTGVEFTGEWIRSRKYICGACFARFNGFWELDDHRWIKHPNVWNFHYEFPIDQVPAADWAMKRSLRSVGVLGKLPEHKPTPVTSLTCTKCNKVVTPMAEFHKHILECGGDTDWMNTIFTPTRKPKKWRPYCGHRRKKTVPKNRMFLRNIPETPVKLPPPPHKQKEKAGDGESIRKMLQNLPPKRITRRVFAFHDIDSRSRRSRHAQNSVMTRKRLERLDPKTSAQIAKAFAVDSYDAVRRVTKKTKPDNSKSVVNVKDSSTVQKLMKTEIKSEPEIDLHLTEVTTSSSSSDTNESFESTPQVPDETVKVEPLTPNESPKSIDPERKEDEDDDREMDLESMKPTGKESPSLPNSSVILEAMRETMRQTDVVIPSQKFNRKKRKRDTKSKKSRAKVASDGGTCEESPGKKRAPNFTSFVCTECHITIFGVSKEVELCDKCWAKNEKNTRKQSQMKTCVKCQAAFLSGTSDVCDKCSLVQKTACISDVLRNGEDFVCSKSTPIDSTNSGEAVVNSTATVTPVSDSSSWTLKLSPTCDTCGKSCQTSALHCNSCSPVVPETIENECIEQSQFQGPDAIVTLSALKREKSDEPCFNCKQESCEGCEDRCIHCSGFTEPGKPFCHKCQDFWRTLDCKPATVIEEEPKCSDCSVMKAGEVTLRKLCDRCNGTGNTAQSKEVESCSTNGSVQTGDTKTKETPIKAKPSSLAVAATSASTITVMSTLAVAAASSTSVPPAHEAAADRSTTPTKNVILICKGCYGLHYTVSSYKEHCEKCPFRTTQQDSEKKPQLLGFGRRNSKGNVEIMQTDSSGPSFEILENFQLRQSEGGDGVNTEPSPDVGSHNTDSSKRPHPARSPKAKKATDESMLEAINSVVQKFCYLNSIRENQLVENYQDASFVPYQSVPGKIEEPVSESTKNIKNKVRRNSPVDTQTRERNMKIVEAELIEELEEIKTKKQPRKILVLPESAETEPDQVKSEDDVPQKTKQSRKTKEPSETASAKKQGSKKSLRGAKTKVVPSGSKRAKENMSNAEPELGEKPKSKKKAPQKRKSETDIAEQVEESVASRLRRRSLVVEPGTKRVLRSKTKTETEQAAKNQTDEEVRNETPLETKNDENLSMSCNVKSKKLKSGEESAEGEGSNENSSESSTKRKSAPSDVAKEIKPKTKISRRKTESDFAAGPSKKNETSNNDLGFSITKTGKTVRKPSKTRSSTVDGETVAVKVENDEITDTESDVNFSVDSSALRSEQTVNNAVVSSQDDVPSASQSQSNERNDFLAEVPSIPLNSLMQTFKGSDYNDEYSCDDEEESMVSNDVKNGFELEDDAETMAESMQSETWYSDAIDFLGERNFKSLGSIIDSVNELLSSPDVAESYSTGEINLNKIAELKDYVSATKENFMMLQNYANEQNEDDFKMDHDDDSDTTTLLDLDEQPKHDVQLETKTKSAAKEPTGNSGKSVKETCDLCDLNFTSIGAFRSHVVKFHRNIISGTLKPLKNEKTRQSTRTQLNGIKTKLNCIHCHKTLNSKAEMALHYKEHLQIFATSKKDNAMLLKKCIADKFEGLLMDNALNNYLRSPHQPENRSNFPLKILAQLSEAKKNQKITQWRAALANMLDLDTNTSTASNTNTATIVPAPETILTEDNGNTSASSESGENGEAYPCPICSETFEQTNQRNRHLIMVHASGSPNNKCFAEAESAWRKELSAKGLPKICDSDEITAAKIIKSYFAQDNPKSLPVKKENVPEQTEVSSSPLTIKPSSPTTWSPQVEQVAVEKESVAAATPITPAKKPEVVSTPPMLAPKPVTVRSGPNATKKPPNKPFRRKMSKKEINLPPEMVKRKAEQALRELTISRFSRNNV